MYLKKIKDIYNHKIKGQYKENNSTGWLLLQQILIAPLSFISTYLLINILSVEDYGVYGYVLNISGMVTIASMNGFSDISGFNIQRGKYEYYLIAFK